jgi:hypothetical protein
MKHLNKVGMPPQYGLYAAIAAASVSALAYDRIKHQFESQEKMKQIHKSIEIACQKRITGIQKSLDASVSALNKHCSDNHRTVAAALRAENNEVLRELQELLINLLNAPDQRAAITAILGKFHDEMRRQAAQSRDEASHVSDLAMQRVKLLEERLDSMQRDLEAFTHRPPSPAADDIDDDDVSAVLARTDAIEKEMKAAAAQRRPALA